MRQDMHKLNSFRSMEVCSPRKLQTRGPLPRDLEALSGSQSLRSSVAHYSYSNEYNLQPLKRWLRKQVGRPWNSVYSELRQQFDSRSTRKGLVLDQALQFVEKKVFLTDDGQARVTGTYGGSYAVDGFYVHPRSNSLMYVDSLAGAAKSRQAYKLSREKAKASVRVQVSPDLQLHKIDGQWYWVELAIVTAPETKNHPDYVCRDGSVIPGWKETLNFCQDVLTGQQFMAVPKQYWETSPLLTQYGFANKYAKRKWQASRRDIARYIPA